MGSLDGRLRALEGDLDGERCWRCDGRALDVDDVYRMLLECRRGRAPNAPPGVCRCDGDPARRILAEYRRATAELAAETYAN